MASEDSANIFALLRSGREGVQFERTFRALSFILQQWYAYKGSRHPDANEPSDKLRAIPFDKLVTLVARLWDKLFRQRDILQADPLSAAVALALDTEGVTFPCPMREMPGKHGPGRAIYDGQEKPEFILSVLYKLQQDDIIHYFTITPPLETRDQGIGSRASPTHPATTITPAVQITDKKSFLKRFTAREVDILTDLVSAIKKLNPSEVRALGTHEDHDETIRAVKWEFNALKRLSIHGSIRRAIAIGAPFTISSQTWLEYADEACSKARENRSVYESGWTIMKAELSDPEVQEVFSSTQASASEIWESPAVGQLWRVAAKSRAVSRYFLAASMGLEHMHGRFGDNLEQARSACRDLGLSTLPDSTSLVSPDGRLLARAQQVLTDILDDIFREMLSCSNA